MERFVNAIKNCLDTENWYGAIVLSLIMPDICGKIAYPNKKPSHAYREWFDDYLSGYYRSVIDGEEIILMTANDCYALRCSIVHEVTGDVSEQSAKDTLEKFHFSTKGGGQIRIDGEIKINVTQFCEEVISATKKWSKDIEGNENAQKAIQELLTINAKFSPSRGIAVE